MKELYISDLEKETGVSKRDIYNQIRIIDFYKQFGIKSMSDLPNGVSNGSTAKILSQRQYNYLKEKIENDLSFRKNDDPMDGKDCVYVVDLCPEGFTVIGDQKQRRFKIGYTSKSPRKREKDFRVTNPEATIVMEMEMGTDEEQVLLKYINGNSCKRIGGTELFDVEDVDDFLNKITEFFESLK
ncbi:MAG: GIY-YIG nuclease family protein [Bacteriovoracaceae bacterium]|nr:GIY-YIG nuclease family protein [Bacteriovoracaceae bacterium]